MPVLAQGDEVSMVGRFKHRRPADEGTAAQPEGPPLVQDQLDACQAELAAAHLLGEGRVGQLPLAERSRPDPPNRPSGPLSPHARDKGRFVLCPGPTQSRAG